MATMPNTNINIPYSAFLDPTTGRPSQAWLLWLMSPSFININLGSALPVTSGGTGLTTIPINGQLLIGNGTGYTLNTLGYGAGISVTNGLGTITVANTGVLSFSGGTTGLTPTPAATGVITLAGTLIAANGGTGFASYAVGDLLYANTTTTLAKLPDVATGNALISGGVITAPTWGKIGLTTHVSGVLPIANGGTNGTSTPTAGAVPYGTGTEYAFTSAGTTGQVLTSAGASVPIWTTPTNGTVTSVGLAMPTQFAVTNSPVTTSGTLTAAWNTQAANVLLAGPASGAGAVPTFRALTTADLPALPYGTGTVTSVGLSLPSIIAVTNSPVTTSGTLTGTLTTQAANSLFAGPSSGAAATPTFRALTTADIPALSYVTSVALALPSIMTVSGSPVTGSGTLTGTLTTQAVNSIFAGPSSGSAAAPTFRALTTADIPALPYGTGTVTSVSVVSANGFAGTVATSTTTPAITISTSITGVLKGNGTAISAATVNVDYQGVSAPVTKTADFTVAATDLWLINNKSGSACTVTLPTASSYSGRVLHFQNYQVQTVISASSNVVPLTGGAAGTSILLASSGDSATLVSDGTNWLITQYTPNNILLLE